MLFLYAVAVLSVIALLCLLVVLSCAAHAVLGGKPTFAAKTFPPYPLLAAFFENMEPSDAVWALLSAALQLGGIYFLCTFLLEHAAQTTALAVAAQLRHDLHRHTFHLSGADVLGRSEHHPVQLFTEEVERVRRGLVAWWLAVPRAPLLLASLVTLALCVHVWLVLSAILLAALLWIFYTWLNERAAQRQMLLADRAVIHMSALVEGLKHSRLVSGYLLDDTPGAPLAETMPRYLKHAQQLHLNGCAVRPLLQYAVFAATMLLLALVGVNVLSEPPQLAAAEGVFLALALFCAHRPLIRLVRLMSMADESDRAAEAILKYLQGERRVREFADAAKLGPLARELRLEDVLLRDSSGHMLLENVSLLLPAKGRVAVVCSDRTASLALACLLPRFYDPDAGRVLYDNQDLRNVTLQSLRSQVALVPQDGLLFSATVRHNIACGDFRLNESELRETIKMLGADEFILRLPQGFDTTIGENGIRLSPAESLLVGLCRAVVRNPSVLIVEEPAEDLDPEEALRVDHALAVAAQERALLCLATRLQTLRTADQVYLLHEGRVQAVGTHAELLQDSDLYRHVIYLRFNEYRSHSAPQRDAQAAYSG